MDVENFYAKSTLDKKDQRRLVAALQRKMRTQREISDKLGIGYGQLRTAYMHLGIDSNQILRDRSRAEEAPYVEAVQKLAGEGKTKEQITEVLNIPAALVRRIYKNYNVVRVRQPRHGTATEYVSFGCRCDACSEANAIRCAEEYRNRKTRVEEAPHGTETGYWNWGCRCDKCSEAGRLGNKRRTETPPETQTRKGERWVEGEVDTLRSYDKLAKEHAIELGRTTASVNTRRAMTGIRKGSNNG